MNLNDVKPEDLKNLSKGELAGLMHAKTVRCLDEAILLLKNHSDEEGLEKCDHASRIIAALYDSTNPESELGRNLRKLYSFCTMELVCALMALRAMDWEETEKHLKNTSNTMAKLGNAWCECAKRIEEEQKKEGGA